MVRVGLVGAGYWAEKQHAPMYSTSDITLAGVWARNPEKASRLATRLQVPVFGSFNALLDACEAVDFAVAPAAQGNLAIQAARAGKHLLLEKPVAADAGTAQELVNAAEHSGVRTVVAFTRRYHPYTVDFLRQVRVLSDDGRVWGCQGTFLHGGLLPGGFVAPATWRSEDTGPLLDLGPHVIDLAMAALGSVARVSTRGGPYTVTTLEHAGGGVSQLAMSLQVGANTSLHELHVHADSGTVSFSKSAVDEATCWRLIYREFAAAVRTGADVTCDARRGLAVQRVLDAAVRSQESGQPVDL